MKRKTLWIILAILAVAAIILMIALPKGDSKTDQEPKSTDNSEPDGGSPSNDASKEEQSSSDKDSDDKPVDGELPMDSSVNYGEENSGSEEDHSDVGGSEDPGETSEESDVDEDELPIIP